MIIKNEVNLHQNSIDYIKRTLQQYEQVDKLSDVIKNPIIHLYPVEDTFNQDGELNGYTDSLFFRADIYNVEDMTVYKGEKLHDGILPFGNHISISQIKIFKDLSTMVVLNGEYSISVSHQAIDIYPGILV